MRSNNEVMWKLLRRTISNTIAASILLFAIGPFWSESDLQRKADDRASSVLNQLLYEPTHQNEIAVALLDDDAFEALGGKWPLPKDHWVEAAQVLACAGAKAIFFDVLLDKEDPKKKDGQESRHTLKSLDQQLWNGEITEICAKQKLWQIPEKTILAPLYFAFTGQPKDWLPNIDDNHKLLIAWEPIGSSYPLAQFTNHTFYKTAACELSTYWPHDRGNPCSKKEGIDNPPLTSKLTEWRVTPLWTPRVDRSQHHWKDVTVCQELRAWDKNLNFPDWINFILEQGQNVPVVREGLIGGRWLLDGLHITDPYLSPAQCPPFLTINLSQLIYVDRKKFAELNDPSTGVRDRIVLLGQSFKGNYDYVPAPMHQPAQLPGIYLHATVLENLLTMEMKFDRIGKYDRIWVLVLVVFFSFIEALITAPPRPWVSTTSWRYWIIGSLAVFFTASLYFRCFLHWPLGLVPWGAFNFTFYLFIVKIFHEGILYEWGDRLFGIDPHHKT